MAGLAATAAVFNTLGEILLVRLAYDQRQWALPGGMVEPGEPPDAAAIREAREETGFDVGVDDLYAVSYTRAKDLIVFSFRCRVTGGTLRIDGDEIADAGFFALDGLPRPMTNTTLARVRAATTRGPVGISVFDHIEYLR